MRWAFHQLETRPNVQSGAREPLRGELSLGFFAGASLPRWQLAVDGGGRIWYLLDEQPFGAGRGRRAGRVIIDQVYPDDEGNLSAPRERASGGQAQEPADGG